MTTETGPPDPNPSTAQDGRPDGDTTRTLEFEIEVAGTPEEVWEAIATGPGISSWYVPHTVEERTGGVASARFGPADDMVVPGRVADWEPPNRVVFDGGPDDDGMAFEWTIEAKAGGVCTVRLVNSGFGSGQDWDAMYDGMRDGWPMFLYNLRLHCQHYRGQHATAMLPTGSWPGSKDEAWPRLLAAVGLTTAVTNGDRIEVAGDDTMPPLAGTVVDVAATRLAILLDGPAPGTAFLATERGHTDDTVEVSVWSYLYGPDRDALAARDQPRWASWLADNG